MRQLGHRINFQRYIWISNWIPSPEFRIWIQVWRCSLFVGAEWMLMPEIIDTMKNHWCPVNFIWNNRNKIILFKMAANTLLFFVEVDVFNFSLQGKKHFSRKFGYSNNFSSLIGIFIIIHTLIWTRVFLVRILKIVLFVRSFTDNEELIKTWLKTSVCTEISIKSRCLFMK